LGTESKYTATSGPHFWRHFRPSCAFSSGGQSSAAADKLQQTARRSVCGFLTADSPRPTVWRQQSRRKDRALPAETKPCLSSSLRPTGAAGEPSEVRGAVPVRESLFGRKTSGERRKLASQLLALGGHLKQNATPLAIIPPKTVSRAHLRPATSSIVRPSRPTGQS